MKKQIKHATAVIRNEQGDVLFMRRDDKLELPGGKVKRREGTSDAVVRETREELDVSVERIRFLGRAAFQHGYKQYNTDFFELDISGQPKIMQPRLVSELVYVPVDVMQAFNHDDHDFSANAQNFRKALRDGEIVLENF